MEVGGDDFFVDLLFYHLKLRAYFVIEIKARKLKPEPSSSAPYRTVAA